MDLITTGPELSLAASTPEDFVASLYEAHRESVYRYLVRFGSPPGEAQEMTQEAFFRLHQAWARGEQIRQPRAWVFAAARNLALNRRDREQAWDPAAHDGMPDTGPGPEDLVLRDERLELLRQEVQKLSPQQRQCLSLRAEGFRYREIAEVTGIGISSVNEFLRRAMTRLRRKLDE